MKGHIDTAGRALLTLRVRSDSQGDAQELIVWVDTAFDGELVVPIDAIGRMGLSQSASVQATLADGTSVVLETFDCEVEWFGQWRAVEAVANAGQLPLLGIGLLKHQKLTIDYRNGEVRLD